MLRRIRLASGLVLFFYVGTHLLNHALGLGSLGALDAGRDVFLAFWRNWPGTVLLYGALLTHLALALYALYQRRSLRLKPLEAAQLLLGFAIPFLLVEHALGTRLLHELYGVTDNYVYVVLVLWVFAPVIGVVQNVFLVVAWTHGCIGMHYWLKLKPWFPRWAPLLFLLAVLLPVCAILGFVATGREVSLLYAQPMWFSEMSMAINLPGEEAVALAKHWTVIGRYIMAGLIAAVLAARGVRFLIEHRRRHVMLSYPDGRRVDIAPGVTVLEASRQAGIPHASVCGGRGRCSTCRVRCGRGIEHLPPPSPEEARVLQRVGAPENVRLACQIRPDHDLEITPLLAPGVGPKAAWRQPSYAQGREREICVLFADIRSFTRFSETRLPYDVVFVLNRYFRSMGEAIETSGGHIDKFIGDGVMALFGTDSGPEEASRRALAAARAMGVALDELNRSLAHDLPEPIRIGIGVHLGPVILGEIGFGRTTSLTAIGDSVNTASRLESATKEFDCQLIVSEALVMRAGLDLSAFPHREIELRGRAAPLGVRAIRHAAELPEIELPPLRRRRRAADEAA
ncbi:MAG: adenylate/guanylate cyclase domain-containing protein [Alphaproteobacteria bacterium]